MLEVFFRTIEPYSADGKWDFTEEIQNKTRFDGKIIGGFANSMGLRDKEYEFKHDTYRILALGDSFTYGSGLRNQNSWPKKTETFLHSKGFNNLEILNGGRPGTDTISQYKLFERFTSKYEPDMVVMGFIINDCTNICSTCGAVNLKNKFEEKIKSKQQIKSYLFRYIELTYLKYKLTRETIAEYSLPYENNSHEFQQCKEGFLKFKNASEQNDFELIVIIYPMLIQLNENYPFREIHKTMEDFLDSEGIKVYDLTPEFYNYNNKDLWLSWYDSHPNIMANEIAAKKISDIIKENLN